MIVSGWCIGSCFIIPALSFRCAHNLVMALFKSSSSPQTSLGHVATCLYDLSSWHDTCLAAVMTMFPAGVAAAPDVGTAVLHTPLDWQCNWLEVIITQ